MVTTNPVLKGVMVGMSPATVNLETEETVKVTCRNTCPVCGKVELNDYNLPDWISRTFPQETHALCDICRAEADRKEMEAYRERQLARLMDEADIPPEFRTWDSSIGNQELARKIRNSRNGSMLVCGFYSKGKTRATAYNLLLEVKNGKSCRFWRFSDLAAKYAAQCKADGDAQDWLKKQMNRDVILIDDICKRRITDTAGEMLYDILDWLYSGEIRCNLWMTANKSLADVAKCFQNADTGDAVVSRIDRMADDYDGRMKIINAE